MSGEGKRNQGPWLPAARPQDPDPDPAVDLLAILHRMQQTQQRQQEQQQLQQQQQQDVLAALVQQLLPAQQWARAEDTGQLTASPPLPAPHIAAGT